MTTAFQIEAGALLARANVMERRWDAIKMAFAYVASRHATAVEGEGWRVERHPSGDIVIAQPSPDGLR